MGYPKFSKNMHCGIAPNATNAEINRQEAKSRDDFYARLAAEIIIHAVTDWRELCKGKRGTYGNNFTELRLFFNSAWCETLMTNFDIEPAQLLEALEKEYEEAIRKEQEKASKSIKEAKSLERI